MVNDYYQLLQLPASASPEDIKQAFRRLARLHHPDRGGSLEQFHRIQAAYEVLRDPERRRQYDRSRQPPAPSASDSPPVKVRVDPPPPPPDPAIEQGLKTIQQHFKHQQWREALQQAEALFQRYPTHPQVIHRLAVANQRLGNVLIYQEQRAEARRYLERALQLEPKNRDLVFDVKRDLDRLGVPP